MNRELDTTATLSGEASDQDPSLHPWERLPPYRQEPQEDRESLKGAASVTYTEWIRNRTQGSLSARVAPLGAPKGTRQVRQRYMAVQQLLEPAQHVDPREMLSKRTVGTAVLRLLIPQARGVFIAIDASRKLVGAQLPREDESHAQVIEKETWERMAEFLIDVSTNFAEHYQGTRIPRPIISPSEEGAIDVQWRLGSRNLLITVERDHNEPIFFNGYDWNRQEHEFRGTVNENSPNGWLLAWLFA